MATAATLLCTFLARDLQMFLSDAVAQHVQSGDALHLVVGHNRWTAAAREVVRQWWGRDPEFTLVMLSLSSLGALFFAAVWCGVL